MDHARMGGRRGRSTNAWLKAGAALACAAGLLVAGPAPHAAADASEWLDPTFGGSGSVVINGEYPEQYLYDGASDPDSDGRFYFVTESYDAGGQNETVRLRRMLSDGTVDPTFGTVVLNTTGFNFMVDNIWIDDVHDTVTVLTTGPTFGDLVLSRFTNTGQPDPAFGTAGKLVVLAGRSADRTPRSSGQAADSSSKRAPPPCGGQLHRVAYLVGVTANGQLDAAWGDRRPRRAAARLSTTARS